MDVGAMRATDPDQVELARRFQHHVLQDIEYLRALGYNAVRFQAMVSQTGGAVGATKRLLADPRHSTYGFERLWEMKELGHTVEFAACLPWFRALFTDAEVEEAERRLLLHEFPLQARLRAAIATPPEWVVG